MRLAFKIFGSLGLIFFGVQICQYGFIPQVIDYEAINAASAPLAEAPADGKLGAIPPALVRSMEVSQSTEENSVLLRKNEELKVENVKLKEEVLRVEQQLAEAHARNSASTKAAEAAPPAQEFLRDRTEIKLYDNPLCDGLPTLTGEAEGAEPIILHPTEFPRSARVQGGGMAEVYIRLSRDYQGILIEEDECFAFPDDQRATKIVQFDLYSESQTAFKNKRQIPDSLQKQFSTASDLSQPHTRIIFSTTSSHYFGYQILANAYSFQISPNLLFTAGSCTRGACGVMSCLGMAFTAGGHFSLW